MVRQSIRILLILSALTACTALFAQMPPVNGLSQVDYYQLLRTAQEGDLLFHSFPLWAVVLNLVAALILFALWLKQRSVSQFNWLIGASLTGSGYVLDNLSHGAFDPFVSDMLVIAWFYFLSRILYNYPVGTLRRWLGTLPVIFLLLFGIAGIMESNQLHAVAIGAYCLVLWVMSSHQFGLRLQRAPIPKLALIIAVWFIALLGILDSLIVLSGFVLDAHPDRILQLMPIGQIFGVFAALYFLVARHSENQHQLEDLNASLDQRVQAAEAELQDRYRMLTRDALDAAAMRERKHIYESIHEDLSDKLLQLVYAAKSPATADLARSALAELRDSRKLHPEQDRPLVDMLADAFAEVQERCDQTNLSLYWHVDEALNPYLFNARQESALTRTIREALSNLIKHAQASEVKIDFHKTGTIEPLLVYTISDNGRGVSPDHRPGRGLVNMRNRMQELGGTAAIVAHDTGGTRVRFSLPLSRADQ